MSFGDSPRDYLTPDLQSDLDEALSQVPKAQRSFELGRVPEARKSLEDAGFGAVARRLDLCMPNKYSD